MKETADRGGRAAAQAGRYKKNWMGRYWQNVRQTQSEGEMLTVIKADTYKVLCGFSLPRTHNPDLPPTIMTL